MAASGNTQFNLSLLGAPASSPQRMNDALKIYLDFLFI